MPCQERKHSPNFVILPTFVILSEAKDLLLAANSRSFPFGSAESQDDNSR